MHTNNRVFFNSNFQTRVSQKRYLSLTANGVMVAGLADDNT